MTEENITVSVVMPVYNGEGFLRECLDSVCGQTLRDIEMICVDDGSSDSSVEILREYAAKDSRVRVVEQPNSGAAVARNKGIEMARGKYLSILDSDDRFERRMLEKMVSRAEKTDAQIVICRCDGFEDGTDKPVPMAWSLQEEFIPSRVFSGAGMGDALFFFAQGWAWDKLYRADFVRENKLEFENLRSSNDLGFTFLSLALAERITTVKDVFVHQRRGRDASLSRSRQVKCDCFYHALLALRGELERRGLLGRTEKAFANLCVHLSMWHFNTLAAHKDSFFFLYDKLREEYLPGLGIGGQPPEYFLAGVRADYAECRAILSLSAQDYLYEKAINGSSEELDELKRSSAYRAGRAITLLPRTAVKGARFVRSCGLGYTLRFALRSMRRGRSDK